MSSNESEEDIFPHPKEDCYGKNILVCAVIRSTKSSSRCGEKIYFSKCKY
jgi:hypothetical protein